MEDFVYFGLARAFHVLGVVLWIGGVAFVTTTLIPSLRKMSDSDKRLALFEQLEGKFAFQARIVTLITGLTGFYMLDYMKAWERYQQIQFWWIHLMTIIWLIFTVVLFVLEPLILHRRFKTMAHENSDRAFLLLHRMHKVLLALSLITIFGTVAGVHGRPDHPLRFFPVSVSDCTWLFGVHQLCHRPGYTSFGHACGFAGSLSNGGQSP
jgi:uncharacterized membrane protein